MSTKKAALRIESVSKAHEEQEEEMAAPPPSYDDIVNSSPSPSSSTPPSTSRQQEPGPERRHSNPHPYPAQYPPTICPDNNTGFANPSAPMNYPAANYTPCSHGAGCKRCNRQARRKYRHDARHHHNHHHQRRHSHGYACGQQSYSYCPAAVPPPHGQPCTCTACCTYNQQLHMHQQQLLLQGGQCGCHCQTGAAQYRRRGPGGPIGLAVKLVGFALSGPGRGARMVGGGGRGGRNAIVS